MWFHNNHTTDCYTPGTGYDVWTADTDAGGTDDGYGKCQFNGSQVTIEMRFPFDSGDAAGKDFALHVGDRIEFNVWYHDETDGINYCQIRTTDVDYDFNVLYIACSKAAPLPIGVIFGGLILTSVAGVLYKRFKK